MREKVGLSVAMSLGALTGVIVILRTFYGLVQGDYNFGMLPPRMPLFRVAKTNTSNRIHDFHLHLQLPRAQRDHHRPSDPHVSRALRQQRRQARDLRVPKQKVHHLVTE